MYNNIKEQTVPFDKFVLYNIILTTANQLFE